MIIQQHKSDTIIVTDEPTTKMRLSLSKGVEAHMIKTMSEWIYKKKIESVCREVVSNAIDSHIQNGTPDKPVLVRLKRMNQNASYYYTKGWYLEVEDTGLGLDEEGFDKYIMQIGESSKQNDGSVLGMYGFGAKSPFAKVNSFQMRCRKDGIERTFLILKGEEVPEKIKQTEIETTEPNGVMVHIDLPNNDYLSEWKRALKEQLSYLPNIVYDIDGEDLSEWNEYKIFRSEDFEWSELNNSSKIHISLQGIFYPIDYSALGISSISVPIAIRIGLNDGVYPVPGREDLQYDAHAKELIKGKLLKVAQWFLGKYNETVKDFDSLLEALPYIGVDRQYITLEGTRMEITELLKFANLKPNVAKIKNIEERDPKFYKDKFSLLFHNYIVVANTENDSWLKKNFSSIDNQVKNRYNVVLLSETPVGRFKTFIREEYSYRTLFVVKNKRSLKNNYKFFMERVELTGKSREERKKLMREWKNVVADVTSKFIDETKLQHSQKFKDWIEEKKAEQKANRSSSSGNYSYKALNKQKGEITIMPARKHKYQSCLVFGKEVAKIEDLHKRGYITIYFKKDEEIDESKITELMGVFPTMQFVKLNDREIKHVTNLHNFKTFKQFMNTKPISRYVTAMKIDEILDLVPDNEDMIHAAFPKFKELQKSLEQYRNTYRQRYISDELKKELMSHAEETNLWDMNIYTEAMEFQKIIKDFGFLNFIDAPRDWNENNESSKIAKNIVYVLLLHKRKTGKLIEEFELVPKPTPVVKDEFDFYQPEIDEAGFVIGHEDEVNIYSYEVWSSKEALMEQYPSCNPIGYTRDQIANPIYKDVEVTA